ncbi:cytochrome c [Dokdonella sp.]|uniref:c-type cytochrome n=1 Tax=Dokdonella sp. TaxID=2291710 RepID=UPI003526CB6E
MAPFAMTLSEQDMHDLGAYFAGKQATPGRADEVFVERAQLLYRSFDAKRCRPAWPCHGPAGRGIAGAACPQLSGQWTDYVMAKFGEWRRNGLGQ